MFCTKMKRFKRTTCYQCNMKARGVELDGSGNERPIHPKGEAVARDCDGMELRAGDTVEFQGYKATIKKLFAIPAFGEHEIEVLYNRKNESSHSSAEGLRKLTPVDGYYADTGKVVRGAFENIPKDHMEIRMCGDDGPEYIIKRCV